MRRPIINNSNYSNSIASSTRALPTYSRGGLGPLRKSLPSWKVAKKYRVRLSLQTEQDALAIRDYIAHDKFPASRNGGEICGTKSAHKITFRKSMRSSPKRRT